MCQQNRLVSVLSRFCQDVSVCADIGAHLSADVEFAFLTSLQEDIWSEESMKGWDDADMGTWSDSTLENNSTWNSATGFNKNLRRNSLKVFKISAV